MQSSDIKNKTVRILYETMLIKKLTTEKAAFYIGCSSVQVWRWIRKGQTPTKPYIMMIQEGIDKINLEIPGDKDGLVAWGRRVEVPEEEEFYNKQFPVFFDALCKKVDKTTRENILFNDDYLHGFREILFLVQKYKVELPARKEETPEEMEKEYEAAGEKAKQNASPGFLAEVEKWKQREEG